MGSNPGRDVERLAKACGRDIAYEERERRREQRAEERARGRAATEAKRSAARAERRSARVASLARELDDRYRDASDDVIATVRRKHEHRVEAAARDWAEMREFVGLVPIGAFLLALLMLGLPFGGLAWVDGLILLALALLVVYGLLEWRAVARASLLADALGEVMSMRAARCGGE